ncbi:unnamed protein product [Oikopleura dioica]|uniref:Uncharacterized protein n=1 Tax=Oikopleura dioica TaxID=34765 RepID=E4YHT2_OIKDI|nr:unnamed protein product [Oikopleura dioica]
MYEYRIEPFQDIRKCILRIRKLEDLFSELDVSSQKYAVRSLYCTPIIDRHFKVSDFSKYASSVGLRNHTDFEASYQYLSRFPKSKALLTASTLELFEDTELESNFKESIVEAVVYQVLFNSAVKDKLNIAAQVLDRSSIAGINSAQAVKHIYQYAKASPSADRKFLLGVSDQILQHSDHLQLIDDVFNFAKMETALDVLDFDDIVSFFSLFEYTCKYGTNDGQTDNVEYSCSVLET